MAVLSPMMTGPGGDAFLLWRDAATGRCARSRAPGRAAAATVEALPLGHDTMPARGGEPVTVPAAVALWGDAAEARPARAGRRCSSPRASLPSAASRSQVSARMWREAEALLPPTRRGGRVPARQPRPGELVRLPDLARRSARSPSRARGRSTRASSRADRRRHARGPPHSSLTGRHRSSWVEPSPPASRPHGPRAAAADHRDRGADDPARPRAPRTSARSIRSAPSASTSRRRPAGGVRGAARTSATSQDVLIEPCWAAALQPRRERSFGQGHGRHGTCARSTRTATAAR